MTLTRRRLRASPTHSSRMGEYGLLVLLLRIAHGAGHLYIHARIYMHFIHLYVQKYMYTCTRPHVYTRTPCAHTLAHKHTHTHTHTHTHIHTHTHAHTHTHTCRCVWSRYRYNASGRPDGGSRRDAVVRCVGAAVCVV